MTEDNLKRTKEAVQEWERSKQARLKMYRNLCNDAGLQFELGTIPDIRIEQMDESKYAMNIVALKKLVYLRAIADYKSA